MKEHGICAKCKKSVRCPCADDRITGCKNFVLEPELKLTNEESLRQCTTEQLANTIFSAFVKSATMIGCCVTLERFRTQMELTDALCEWLKQPKE